MDIELEEQHSISCKLVGTMQVSVKSHPNILDVYFSPSSNGDPANQQALSGFHLE